MNEQAVIVQELEEQLADHMDLKGSYRLNSRGEPLNYALVNEILSGWYRVVLQQEPLNSLYRRMEKCGRAYHFQARLSDDSSDQDSNESSASSERQRPGSTDRVSARLRPSRAEKRRRRLLRSAHGQLLERTNTSVPAPPAPTAPRPRKTDSPGAQASSRCVHGQSLRQACWHCSQPWPARPGPAQPPGRPPEPPEDMPRPWWMR